MWHKSANLNAKKAAQWAYKHRQIKAALKFRELWKANPEGMERRRKAGTRKAAERHKQDGQMWAEYWSKVPDLATPAEAKERAEAFLVAMRGCWRSVKKRPKCARSVLKRLSKMGLWAFDISRGLWVNPRNEARRVELAEQQRAEEELRREYARADEERRQKAQMEAERVRQQEQARAAEKEAREKERAREGWHDFIPAEYKAEALAYALSRKMLADGQGLDEMPAYRAQSWEAAGWDGLGPVLEAGRIARLRPYAEALLCA